MFLNFFFNRVQESITFIMTYSVIRMKCSQRIPVMSQLMVMQVLYVHSELNQPEKKVILMVAWQAWTFVRVVESLISVNHRHVLVTILLNQKFALTML